MVELYKAEICKKLFLILCHQARFNKTKETEDQELNFQVTNSSVSFFRSQKERDRRSLIKFCCCVDILTNIDFLSHFCSRTKMDK